MVLADVDRLLAHRAIAQLLAPAAAAPRPRTARETANHMLASQAQQYAWGVAALATRVTPVDATEYVPDDDGGGNRAGRADAGSTRCAARSREPIAPPPEAAVMAVRDAIGRGEVLRSWSQRGTHHLVDARDERWLKRLCSPRPHAAAAKRRHLLDLEDDDVDRARDVLHGALAEASGGLPRSRIAELWAAAGIYPGNGRASHLLRYLGEEREVVQAPRTGSEDVFALHDDVVPDPVDLAGDDALCELGARYGVSRGPATTQDLAFWSGLTVRDAARALQLVAGDLLPVEFDGTAYVMAPWQADVTEAELAAALEARFLLPGFDEWLLGYRDRSATLPERLVKVVGPTANGLVNPFVVERGQVTGRWDGSTPRRPRAAAARPRRTSTPPPGTGTRTG